MSAWGSKGGPSKAAEAPEGLGLQRVREIIADDVAEFLEAGGKVEVVPTGKSGDPERKGVKHGKERLRRLHRRTYAQLMDTRGGA